MAAAGLEAVLRRDRVIVAAALAALTVFAWAYILWLAATMDMGGHPDGGQGNPMSGMAMPGKPGMGDGGIVMPQLAPWSAGEALLMLVMWTVMMIGMMTPSAAPMILLYARVGRQAEQQGKPFAATAWFAAGYLASWVAFSVLATAAQWALEQGALLTPMMTSASPVLGGLALIGAGLYQWTPFKDTCLTQCQSPLAFIQRHGGFRRQRGGAFSLGVRHGAYCIGCCWALMALLFVVGVMNIVWIAALAVLVLIEKVTPAGRTMSRIAGVGLAAAGLAMLAGLIGTACAVC
ncbi:DUF2182 domain-containing protein [Rhodoligotrophos defluvii]|uniref:DUF2182 domain-containing protein n=1 Tax=Rhodoligotrophos defluvii TaxID=2561934 RepID=UPI0010C9F811|nr:DUF2182 domain-containing protein [Rhodoligotrophos defluvii]